MDKKSKIVIASDHGGYKLKKLIVAHLKKNPVLNFEDLGCFDDSSVDYPDYASFVASRISEGRATWGILVCGTGIGMAIAANKFKGVRASVVSDLVSARMTREHNDLNVLCLGERVIDSDLALEIVDLFLKTAFAGGRHLTRVNKIKHLEEKNANQKS